MGEWVSEWVGELHPEKDPNRAHVNRDVKQAHGHACYKASKPSQSQAQEYLGAEITLLGELGGLVRAGIEDLYYCLPASFDARRGT